MKTEFQWQTTRALLVLRRSSSCLHVNLTTVSISYSERINKQFGGIIIIISLKPEQLNTYICLALPFYLVTK